MDRERDGMPVTSLRELRILQTWRAAATADAASAAAAAATVGATSRRPPARRLPRRARARSRHPAVVELRAVVTGAKRDAIFLVFEYCDHDLAQLLDARRQPFTEAEIKCLVLQARAPPPPPAAVLRSSHAAVARRS